MTTSFFRMPMHFPMSQRCPSNRSREPIMQKRSPQAPMSPSPRQNHKHLEPRIAPLQQTADHTILNVFRSPTLADHSSIA